MGICNLGGRNDLFHCSIFHSEGYVVEYGVIEQYGFLIDVSYQASQIFHTEVAYVGPVKSD